ncbi:MAG: SDR family oxidoreductase [Roseitalea porphyridii]|jgi:2-keto-3-deoxy-L-fuconate dehydrogenase|uniref:SDR family oxidoreductase n=1 Tax=Roseitalea porphyridii TaxID=1852022 RepID=UPI0032EC75C9
MAGRLEGKIAVVTAAGQGIGRAIADRFAEEGAQVWASDLDAAKLDNPAFADARALDVTDTGAVDAYAGEVGQIDVLANVAGFVHHGTILDCDEKDWDFSFDLNVKSMHRTMRAFVPAMLHRAKNTGRTASIINMSSGASSLKGAPNRYVYGATKAAIIGMTKAVAVDFAARQLRCNAICPGTVDSPSLQQRMTELGKKVGSYDEAFDSFLKRQPMGRIAEPREIADMAVYLASDEAAFVTGTTMVIDGGWTL